MYRIDRKETKPAEPLQQWRRVAGGLWAGGSGAPKYNTEEEDTETVMN